MDDFENKGGQEKFIDDLSKNLWINSSQVEVTGLKSGSVIIDYKIKEDENNILSLSQIKEV